MPFLGEISALLTACSWSGSSIAFAEATKRVSSVIVNVVRLTLAATILLLVVLLFRIDLKLSVAQMEYLAISGIIGFAAGDSFLFLAFQRLGARITMLVMSLAPAVAAALAYLILDESLSIFGLTGIALTMLGICIVILERKELNGGSRKVHLSPAGILLAVLAAVGQGSGLVCAKIAFREGNVNGFSATLVRIVASLLVLIPVTLVAGKLKNPVAIFRTDRKAFRFTVLGSIFGPFLGVVGSLVAIQHTKIGIAATLMATTPLIMLPLVHIIHKERLGWRAFAGSFVAVAGVAVLFLH